jgi:hypothetical protein
VGPPQSPLGAHPAGGPKKGNLGGLCGCFYPSFAVDRTMSLSGFCRRFFFLYQNKNYPTRRSGGGPPMGGGGPKQGPGGPPPGGPPGGGGSRRAVLSVGRAATRGPPGGYPPRDGPPDPPRGPQGPTVDRPGDPAGAPPGPPPGPWGVWGLTDMGPMSGRGRGPPPGGPPPGGPRVAALPTDNTALLEPPPRGAPRGGPPGGHFWGVRTRWGQHQAKSSLTVVYRGGRGAPPKAHWVRSLQGGPKRAQF